MKATRLTFAVIGALVELLACVAYLLFGPHGHFGESEAVWTGVLFYPGLWVGWHVYMWFKASRMVYTSAGVLAMMCSGAILGVAAHALVRNRLRHRRLALSNAPPAQSQINALQFRNPSLPPP
jgi:hypothetical protein